MKTSPLKILSLSKSLLAFTMVEVAVGIAIMTVMFVSLYGGITAGFAVTQLARENLRGTQIILERLEGLRLFNWDQVVHSNMIPATFTNYYYPLGTNLQSKGILYYGTMTITNTALNPTVTYNDSMRTVTVNIYWTNGIVPRTRTMQTFMSKNGIQNYVYYD
jgi:hypothetical protein